MSIDLVGFRIFSPLAAFAEGYGTELVQLGYAPASVRQQMRVLADLSGWRSYRDRLPTQSSVRLR